VLRTLRAHLTYANVMVTLLAFVVLGGGAYAAFHLPRNSVRSKHIVNHQVKAKDLAKPQAIRSAHLAENNTFDCSPTPDQWVNFVPSSFGPVGFYREITGRVHLIGHALKCGNPAFANGLFTLPPGYRPTTIVDDIAFASDFNYPEVRIEPDGTVLSGGASGTYVALDGISFRCSPSGKNGCP
jgi:hypothetical protein